MNESGSAYDCQGQCQTKQWDRYIKLLDYSITQKQKDIHPILGTDLIPLFDPILMGNVTYYETNPLKVIN